MSTQAATPADTTFLSVHAGQVRYDAETGEATPLRGQGSLVVKVCEAEPDMLAVQWRPRGSSIQRETEELMLLPGDVVFSPVNQCTTGRVISMRFQSSGERHLFWLQQPAAGNDLGEFDKSDEQVLDDLNKYANRLASDEADE